MKTITSSLIILLFCAFGQAQKFSFLPEAGLLYGQIDGDKLHGYHKTGFIAGIGTYYPLGNGFNLAVKTSFYKQGSVRKDRFQDKLPSGIQLEMDLNTVGLEVSAMYAPTTRAFFFGAGAVHHQILDFDYKIIDNVISGPERIIDPRTVSSSFNNLKIFIGWSFATSFRFTIAYERSFTDILKEDFINITRLHPYHLAFTFSYEINPVTRKKTKAKKERSRR